MQTAMRSLIEEPDQIAFAQDANTTTCLVNDGRAGHSRQSKSMGSCPKRHTNGDGDDVLAHQFGGSEIKQALGSEGHDQALRERRMRPDYLISNPRARSANEPRTK
jgi:hypothetical protein